MIRVKTPTHNSITVGTASTQVLPENARRRYAAISNSSGTGVWLAMGAPAQVGYGIYVPPNGGAYEIDADNLFPGAINAVVSTGSVVIGTLELQ